MEGVCATEYCRDNCDNGDIAIKQYSDIRAAGGFKRYRRTSVSCPGPPNPHEKRQYCVGKSRRDICENGA
jgi:hypothetical protein